ncbi:MAG: hypothetical protein KJ057_09815 [Phycisphaerae bacterium]|nr:MAG: hypothetical protein EDS66_15910 [Planctomycetota bacterium]MBE7458211.1 hypothetical protein [Planctomycetia bacterium]MCL4718754.1 hypothetical protein [Phycisphaerae bacterium]
MGNTPIVIRKSISSTANWVRLSDVALVADIALRFGSTTFSVRVDGGDPVALNVANVNLEFAGVDLSRIEISTTSGVPVDAYVVGNTRGA